LEIPRKRCSGRPFAVRSEKDTGGGNFDPHDNSKNTVEVAILKKTRDHNLLLEKRGKLNILSLNISVLYVKTVFFFFNLR